MNGGDFKDYEMSKMVTALQVTIENGKDLADYLAGGKWRNTATIENGVARAFSATLSWGEDQHAQLGDYVVIEPDGTIRAWDRDVFEGTFREVNWASTRSENPLQIPGCF